MKGKGENLGMRWYTQDEAIGMHQRERLPMRALLLRGFSDQDLQGEDLHQRRVESTTTEQHRTFTAAHSDTHSSHCTSIGSSGRRSQQIPGA